MNRLYIADVSSLIYSGHYTQLGKNIKGMPIDGILGLTRWVAMALGSESSILLAFDDKSFRKEIFDGYKGERTAIPAVEMQKQFAYEAMLACNIKPHKFSGMEADDIMAWATHAFESQFFEMEILTNDMDAAHLVRNSISIHAVSSSGHCVGGYNFEKTVVFGETVKWNTIAVHKMLFGCNSDCIPAFKSSSGISNAKIYKLYCDFLDAKGYKSYQQTSSISSFIEFANESGLFSEADMANLAMRSKLIYPAKMPSDAILIPANKSNVNLEMLQQLLTALNDNHSLKCLDMQRAVVTKDTWQFIDRYRDKFISGEFSVDNNLPVAVDTPESIPLTMDYIKEF